MKPLLEPILVTRRLTLRPPREGDVDALVAAVGDFSVSRWLGRVPHPYARADGEAFVAQARRSAAAGTSLNLSIFQAGKLIGGIGISAMPRTSEFGYWLAQKAWGRGLATEAGHAVLAYGFEILGLRLVRSGALVANAGSLRVQAKLGFRRIGLSRRLSLSLGRSIDHVDTILTRPRFEALRR